MPDRLPGAHQCIGTARTVTDIVFRSLRRKCIAGGGALFLAELDQHYAQFIESFAHGHQLFEMKHYNCMGASLARAAMPFSHNKILATLLRTCGEQSARGSLTIQVARLGEEWLAEFFDSLARYVRHYRGVDLDRRLIKAYIDLATIQKDNLTIQELLKQEPVKAVLLECLATFKPPELPPMIITDATDWINEDISTQRYVRGADASKVIESEMARFLTLLPQQLMATLEVISEVQQITESAASPVQDGGQQQS